MPRFAPQPDEPAYDDETPEHVQKRMAALEKLVVAYVEAHRANGDNFPPDGNPAATLWADLDRRACELLDLDPPGFDPSTEGP